MGFLSRNTIGLTGYSGSEKSTVDLDLVDAFDGTYPNTVTQHPIEKDSDTEDFNMIADHIEPKPSVITIKAILSDSSDSAKDKFKTIIAWQRSGAVLKLEGYNTGGLFGKISAFFTSGVGALFNSDLEEPFYLGIDTDIIENIVLSNISFERNNALGGNIRITFNLQRIQISVAEFVTRGAVSRPKVKNAGTETAKIAAKQKTVKLSSAKGS